MEKWKQRGIALLVWVLALVILLVGIAATLLLLQMREVAATTSRSEDHISAKVDILVDALVAPCPAIRVSGEQCPGLIPQASAAVNTLNSQVARFGSLIDDARPAVRSLAPAIAHMDDAAQLAGHRLNDLCPTAATPDEALHPCGTLPDVNRLLATLRGTAGTVEVAAMDFNKHDGALYAQEAQLATSLQATVNHVNLIAGDPNIPAILGGVNLFLDTGNHMLATGDAVETKLARCTLHPNFTCYIKSDALFGAQLGGYFLR